MLTKIQEIPAGPPGDRPGACAEHHPPPAVLRQFARGELTPAGAKAVVRHLLRRCGSCAAAARQAYPGLKEDQP